MKHLRGINLFLLFLALIFFSFASTTSAEIKPGSMSLNPQIGWLCFDHTENDVNLKNNALFGLSFRSFLTENWSIEGLIGYAGTETEDTNIDVNAYLSSFNVSYHFKDYNRFVPYVTAGLGLNGLDPDLGRGDADFIFDYGAGVDYFISQDLSIRFDARHLISMEDSDDNFLAMVGLCFFFGGPKAAPPPPPAPKDSDGDGVYDDQDQCPGTGKWIRVDKKGCPLDDDKDGVPNHLDQCPLTPKWVRVDKKGCPLDDDKDGVPNHLDQCPLTPAGVAVDAKGCPLDSDDDGVPDYLDKCPGTPKSVKVDNKGCPLDTDRDGVYDYLDKCPGTPFGAEVDSRGCWVLKGLYFDTNKSDIKPKYNYILDAVISVMKKNPDLKIEIQGHTDSVGDNGYNQKLSEKRAQSVLEYFAGKGISRSRMSAIGYGETKPITTNETKEGRSQNRRVELKPVK